MVRICESLPNTKSGGHLTSQLLSSGTSPAPDYAEARGAERERDFVHKLKVVLKKLNRNLVWLSIIRQGEFLDERLIPDTEEECVVLCRIIPASINTVKKRCGMETQSLEHFRG
jgi:four helix bundle protein